MCVLVDDEPLALGGFARCSAKHEDVEVLAECEEAAVAIEAMRTTKPDVVFLDIQMQKWTTPAARGTPRGARHGPDLRDRARRARGACVRRGRGGLPAQAVRPDAVVTGPGPRGAALTVDRGATLGNDLREVLASLRGRSKYLERVAVQIGRRTIFVRSASIDWIEADGNSCISMSGAGGAVSSARGSASWSRRLDTAQLARVDRSAIVRPGSGAGVADGGAGGDRVAVPSPTARISQ